jgi:hypothetical protein
MMVLSKKCTTRIGSPILYLYPRKIKIGGCVLITDYTDLNKACKKDPFGLP